ncbi:Fimbrial assembly protein (PilN) [Halobacteroides halobius DSM 5150]|uniref:Fimbrial assembly protein (PilN) n=1 Tax=Halobacteroides halobius (strain ATCC 35273 / DSM 5150 / MD-1) TaxID=748449 RepID=L0KCB4_HALHC|nr:PilN domain-containing protein [Halobacteroides halobius]AGB41718.1 Fimbrial assembly protein (PilN) [Halobacteroides halobius DSM 5150]
MANLLPSSYKKSRLNSKTFISVILGTTLVLSCGFYYFNLLVKVHKLEKKVNLVNKQLGQINLQEEQLKKLEKKIKKIKNALTERKSIGRDKVKTTIILKELSSVIPNQSWISKLTIYNYNSFKLLGYTVKRRNLKIIINRLNKMPFIKELSVEFIEQRDLSNKDYNLKKILYYQLQGKLVFIREDLNARAGVNF